MAKLEQKVTGLSLHCNNGASIALTLAHNAIERFDRTTYRTSGDRPKIAVRSYLAIAR